MAPGSPWTKKRFCRCSRFALVHSRILWSINSQARGAWRSATRLARKASSIVEQWTQTSALTRGGRGSHANVLSVKNANVPYEPANNQQKLKGGPSEVNGAQSPRKSTA